MTISSRTPEGSPQRCPICGEAAAIETSPGGDSCCPACGHLLWWFRNRIETPLGISEGTIKSIKSLTDDLGSDSLDVVELVMELEEEFDLNIPEDDVIEIKTIKDLIHYIRRHGRGDFG